MRSVRIRPAPPPPSLELQLDRAVSSLDNLVGEVRLGVRSQAQFDDLEQRAQEISAEIVAAFRGERRA